MWTTQVVLRVRPFTTDEIKDGKNVSCITVDSDTHVTLRKAGGQAESKKDKKGRKRERDDEDGGSGDSEAKKARSADDEDNDA